MSLMCLQTNRFQSFSWLRYSGSALRRLRPHCLCVFIMCTCYTYKHCGEWVHIGFTSFAFLASVSILGGSIVFST